MTRKVLALIDVEEDIAFSKCGGIIDYIEKTFDLLNGFRTRLSDATIIDDDSTEMADQYSSYLCDFIFDCGCDEQLCKSLMSFDSFVMGKINGQV